ncbi:hypothetical protein [Novosphingobium sp. HII-3]|uniref:hypothetical protein n=1 Tax=Novosphingobium sp. HII-3 TaxID=2075565 RepID=UPI000CDAFF36|nr:hypothetical protein [Novosphingobium sp. HII-3]
MAIMEDTMLNLDPSQRKTSHFDKDQAKADLADKFIGRGSPRSSTRAYALAVGHLANTGRYTRDDIVMISAEGDRAGRVRPDFAEIQLAMDAGAQIITDTIAHRERRYNCGEREVAGYLSANGYVEFAPGRWRPAAP